MVFACASSGNSMKRAVAVGPLPLRRPFRLGAGQQREWIDRGAVLHYRVVEMRTGRDAGEADEADHLPTLHDLSRPPRRPREGAARMPVLRYLPPRMLRWHD